MSDCKKHEGDHKHEHQDGCGHTKVKHEDHVDYLHDGHLHHKHGEHYDDHKIEASDKNPDQCKPVSKDCDEHKHGADCGHEAVPHGDHVDYIVDGRLHHPHGDHCDDHGPIETTENKKK
ncbi:MAG: hypothetical protein ACJA0H_001821 [Francisellaceae bacterium]|jgi:hypothetical protein